MGCTPSQPTSQPTSVHQKNQQSNIQERVPFEHDGNNNKSSDVNETIIIPHNSSDVNENKKLNNDQTVNHKSAELHSAEKHSDGDCLLNRPRTVSILTDDGHNDYLIDNVHSDVVKLYEAMNGIGCCEADLVTIIVPSPSIYRQSLREKFQESYEEDLIKCVKRNTSGKLQYFLVHLLMNKHEFISSLMADYLEDRRYVWIAEILTSFNACDISNAKHVYSQHFQSAFEADVNKSMDDLVPANVKEVFLPMSSLQRHDSKEIDDNCVQDDTDRLNDGPNGITEVLLLKPHNRATLAAIFRNYKLKYYLDIVESIDIEFHDDAKTILLTIVQIAEDASRYFGNELVQAIEREDQKRILDILVARQQIDLVALSSYYSNLKSDSLLDVIRRTFRGSCEEAVCLFIQRYVNDPPT